MICGSRGAEAAQRAGVALVALRLLLLWGHSDFAMHEHPLIVSDLECPASLRNLPARTTAGRCAAHRGCAAHQAARECAAC